MLMESAIARLGGGSHPQPEPEPTISQKQYQALVEMSKRNGYSTAGFGELLVKYGFCRGGEITQKVFPQLCSQASDRSIAQKMNARAESEMVRH